MTDEQLHAQYEDEIAEASKPAGSDEELEGITLQPYTPDRAWAAQAMGLKYGFIDDAGVDEFKRSGIYPGAARDCGIVLWLRSLTDPVEIDKAARNPIAATRKAADWSQAHNMGDVRSEKFWTAYNIFINTMTEVAEAQTTPKK